MNLEIVKKIDKSFLERGTREEFRAAILELLGVVEDLAQKHGALTKRTTDLENELRLLRGEKKSPNFPFRKN